MVSADRITSTIAVLLKEKKKSSHSLVWGKGVTACFLKIELASKSTCKGIHMNQITSMG